MTKEQEVRQWLDYNSDYLYWYSYNIEINKYMIEAYDDLSNSDISGLIRDWMCNWMVGLHDENGYQGYVADCYSFIYVDDISVDTIEATIKTMRSKDDWDLFLDLEAF